MGVRERNACGAGCSPARPPLGGEPERGDGGLELVPPHPERSDKRRYRTPPACGGERLPPLGGGNQGGPRWKGGRWLLLPSLRGHMEATTRYQ